MRNINVSKQTLRRLPLYLSFLKNEQKKNIVNISSVTIAEALRLNDVQVRKDLAAVSTGGKPKIGYFIDTLISEIEYFLGYDATDYAVLIGAGKLGGALMGYKGFKDYGLEIVAAFDANEDKVGTEIGKKKVYSLDKLPDICKEKDVKIGIITVPEESAQSSCDLLIDSGILAIWNFTSVHLAVPERILVQDENMAYSLAALSMHLTERIQNTQENNNLK